MKKQQRIEILEKEIQEKQNEFRRIHSLNLGVIRGAISTENLQREIFALQAELKKGCAAAR